MSKIVWVIIILLVVVGGYFVLRGPEATAPSEESTVPAGSEEPENPAVSNMPVPGNENVDEMVVTHTVTYTNAGYSPSELRIKAGETVEWENKSGQNMWTASALHPTHIVYSGTSLESHCPDLENITFDACTEVPPGEEWSFTFQKAGSWGYHNHLNPTLFGKIVVE